MLIKRLCFFTYIFHDKYNVIKFRKRKKYNAIKLEKKKKNTLISEKKKKNYRQ